MNVIDEYDKGEPQRDARRLTVRWKAEGRNVMTDDGRPDEMALHIATFASPAVAQHITELHNRTFGDGQDPPGRTGTAREAVVNVSVDWERIRPHVQRLIDKKAAELLASQPVLVQLGSDPARMADVLRKLGYEVTEPKEGT